VIVPATRRPAQGLTITIAGLAGVASCVAVTGYTLATEPSATLSPSWAATLAAVLAGCLWLTLAPPRALTTSKPARRVGLGVALALGTWLFLTIHHGGEIGFNVLFAPTLAICAASAVVALAGRALSAGVQAAVWAVVFTCLLTFALYVAEGFRRHHLNGTSILDGDTIPISANLYDALGWVLVPLLVWALPYGIIGAALGTIHTNTRNAADPPPASAGAPPTP
jgi:hypothetical protein